MDCWSIVRPTSYGTWRVWNTTQRSVVERLVPGQEKVYEKFGCTPSWRLLGEPLFFVSKQWGHVLGLEVLFDYQLASGVQRQAADPGKLILNVRDECGEGNRWISLGCRMGRLLYMLEENPPQVRKGKSSWKPHYKNYSKFLPCWLVPNRPGPSWPCWRINYCSLAGGTGPYSNIGYFIYEYACFQCLKVCQHEAGCMKWATWHGCCVSHWQSHLVGWNLIRRTNKSGRHHA